jgi:hypothetical protein
MLKTVGSSRIKPQKASTLLDSLVSCPGGGVFRGEREAVARAKRWGYRDL